MTGVDSRKLRIRTLSAAVLAPVLLGCVYVGGWPFIALMFCAFAVSAHEWLALSLRADKKFLYASSGVLYLIACFASFIAVRQISNTPFPAIALLFLVWFSDVGAYFAGKLLGGPKLLVKISPNKTWAGLFGAVLAPVLLAVSFMFFFGGECDAVNLYEGPTPGFADRFQDENCHVNFSHLMFFAILAGVIGLAGQAGDLLVSAMKRKVDVKDTGNLIPGHGGLLDRIDSLLLCSVVYFVFIMVVLSEAAAI